MDLIELPKYFINKLETKLLPVLTRCRMFRQNASPFGGHRLIFLGDFYQLEPVGAIALSRGETLGMPQGRLNAATNIFASIFDLHEQMVILCSPRFLHNAEDPKAGVAAFLKNVKVLTKDDCRAFNDAIIVVPVNFERCAINEAKALQFAMCHRTARVSWNGGCFVQNAPCVLTENIDVSKKLCNGTLGTMLSLVGSFEHEIPLEGFAGIQLDYALTSIVVATMEGCQKF